MKMRPWAWPWPYEHERQKSPEAEASYQQAIQAHPNRPLELQPSSELFYRRRNQYDKALQMFAKVIQIAPEWYGTYVNVGAIYNDMGQLRESDRSFEKVHRPSAPAIPGYVNSGRRPTLA